MDDLDKLAIENFREYLRIPSVHPDVNYDDCVTFIQNQARTLDLPVQVYRCFPNKPIVVVTWLGKEPNLPSILLNGHMDVVPVYKEKWIHDPFAAEMDEKGDIYARGSQDMKCVSIQYLEAIRRLKKNNVALRRTIHISFVPDEEIGGIEGMTAFVKTKDFKELNVGFALDEGMPDLTNSFPVIYGERTRWVLCIHCPGQVGHGSLLLDNTAGEKVSTILDKLYEFRQLESKKLNTDSNLTIGDVTSINLTMVEGGAQSNVIPPEFTLVVDIRISTSIDIVKFEERLNKWCKEAGDGVRIEYEQKEQHIPPTKLDETNPFWLAFKKASEDMNMVVKPLIHAGITDSRFLRALGIPSLGFSPLANTPLLPHDHNEYLNKDTFLRGIGIYYNLITAVGNV